MKRTFRLNGETIFTYVVPCVAIAYIFAVISRSGLHKPQGGPIPLWISFGLIVASLVLLALDVVVTRVAATSEGLAVFSLFNRRRLEFGWGDLQAYRMTRMGDWSLYVNGQEQKLPKIDVQDFHTVIVSMAPGSLGAKRWKCGQMPPSEDFRNLFAFDARHWVAIALATLITGVPFLILLAAAGWGFIAIAGVRCLYGLRDLFARVDITTDGVAIRRPLQTRSLAWSDVRAIFCERIGSGRAFVLVGSDFSITIPAPISRDLEYMRKVFYSLPQGILAVNFGPNYRRGYRIRRRKRSAAPVLDQLPEFT